MISSKLLNLSSTSLRALRLFSTSFLKYSAYDSDGKTTVSVLNKEPGYGIMVDAYTRDGFRLNNGMFVIGPMVLFPRTALSWNVEGDHEIGSKSLSLFPLIEPKLDILVIGYGKTQKPFNEKDVHAFRIKKKLNIEILPVEKAIATFNYLCSEGRWVAGAFIPPAQISELMAPKDSKEESFTVD